MSRITKDKLLHSFYGTIVFTLCLLVTDKLMMSLGVVFVIAIMKEVYDELVYGGFDWKDIGFTILVPILLVIVI